MGTSKAEFFSKKHNAMATLMKALGHPARIAIVEFLLKENRCICSDIVDELPLAQATVSQHLKELKQAGIIRGNVEGNALCYCLDGNTVKQIVSYFTEMKKRISNNESCC